MDDPRDRTERERVDEALTNLDHARRDVDLGLMMVNGLVRRGEFRAAVRLVHEIRSDVAVTLRAVERASAVDTAGQRVSVAPDDRDERSPEPAGRVRRGAVVVGTIAAALGLGFSAAAYVVSPPSETPAPTRTRITTERSATTVPGEAARARRVERRTDAEIGELRVPGTVHLHPAPPDVADDPAPTPAPTDLTHRLPSVLDPDVVVPPTPDEPPAP